MKRQKPRPSTSDGKVIFGTETDAALAWLAELAPPLPSEAEGRRKGFATVEQISVRIGLSTRAALVFAEEKTSTGEWECEQFRSIGNNRSRKMFRPLRR